MSHDVLQIRCSGATRMIFALPCTAAHAAFSAGTSCRYDSWGWSVPNAHLSSSAPHCTVPIPPTSSTEGRTARVIKRFGLRKVAWAPKLPPDTILTVQSHWLGSEQKQLDFPFWFPLSVVTDELPDILAS